MRGAQVGERRVDDHAEPVDCGIVVDHEHVVGGAPHVELDAVGAQLAGALEGGKGVLGRGRGRAAVAENERATGHRLLRSRRCAPGRSGHAHLVCVASVVLGGSLRRSLRARAAPEHVPVRTPFALVRPLVLRDAWV